jgi:O-acetylhomoserine (thiol)-lyase
MSQSIPPKPGVETLAVHAGGAPDPHTGARQTPIYQTTSYVFDDADHAASLFNLQLPGFIYSRLTNPTVAVLEERVAALEGGRGGTATASGHAAQILALFPLMGPGDEVVAANKLYGGSLNQMGHSYKKFGWKAIFVDPDDPANFTNAITDRTKAIFIESLANPGGIVVDIAAIAEVAKQAGIPLLVDNTMATPYLCRPIEHGADIVIHSTTKFLSGNGTAVLAAWSWIPAPSIGSRTTSSRAYRSPHRSITASPSPRPLATRPSQSTAMRSGCAISARANRR